MPWRALNYTLILISLGLHFSLFGPGSAFGINGPQLIGFSSESTALAGAAPVAVADTSAINTNPAALSLIQGTRFDFTAGPLQAFLHHSDVFGNNNVAGQNNVFVIGNAGFATRPTSVPGLTVGAGIFTQGGFVTEFQNLATAFGTRDDTSSFLRYFKFAIALSYEVTDKLSLGIAPNIGYSDVSLSLFPGRRFFRPLPFRMGSQVSAYETAALGTEGLEALPILVPPIWSSGSRLEPCTSPFPG
jgi:long-subunit fatty acid transport protein